MATSLLGTFSRDGECSSRSGREKDSPPGTSELVGWLAVGRVVCADRDCSLRRTDGRTGGREVHASMRALSEIVNHGKLVSDEIIINLLSKRLEEGGDKGELGFILDGFPRTIRQAEILEGVTDIDLVINLKLREEALLAKCVGRRKCSQCGGNFNVASIDIEGENGGPRMYMPPLLPPPQCESKLITRADDTEEVVKERLRVYHDLCEPVEDFYRARGKLLEFDLPGGIPESWPKLLQALNIEEDPDNNRSAAA
ncbi:putative adenylate kinase 1, chloroplastic [Triticum urartu]|uniref:adenylate kinase n=1 Tax=Triticum urartu TaxID=4572 RepID=M8ASX4_TRIUA|nr:putative adenylate kinase 1, chloroplastic [Triticum urartu]